MFFKFGYGGSYWKSFEDLGYGGIFKFERLKRKRGWVLNTPEAHPPLVSQNTVFLSLRLAHVRPYSQKPCIRSGNHYVKSARQSPHLYRGMPNHSSKNSIRNRECSWLSPLIWLECWYSNIWYWECELVAEFTQEFLERSQVFCDKFK